MSRPRRPLAAGGLRGLLAAALAAGCAGGPADRAPLKARLHEVAGRFETFGFGGSVLVARNGEILLHSGYGVADTATGRAVDSTTVFAIGSVTKQFTAAAVLALERDGKLRPEARLGSILDSVPPELDCVSLHHVLTHTSGLVRDVGDDYDTIAREPYLDSLFARPLRSPPGDEYAYSNAGYSLLGAVVEIASGRDYESFLRERFFDPLGMSRTGYLRDLPGAEAVRYQNPRTEHESPLERPLFWALKGNGGLLSTTGDLHRWIRALVAGEALGRDAWFELTAPLARISPEESYGYGWKVGVSWRGTRAIWHEGVSAEGVGALVRWLPEENAAIIVLGHTIRDDVIPGFRVAHALERVLMGEEVSVAPPPGADRPAGPASRGAPSPVGTYRLTGGGSVTVAATGEDGAAAGAPGGTGSRAPGGDLAPDPGPGSAPLRPGNLGPGDRGRAAPAAPGGAAVAPPGRPRALPGHLRIHDVRRLRAPSSSPVARDSIRKRVGVLVLGPGCAWRAPDSSVSRLGVGRPRTRAVRRRPARGPDPSDPLPSASGRITLRLHHVGLRPPHEASPRRTTGRLLRRLRLRIHGVGPGAP